MADRDVERAESFFFYGRRLSVVDLTNVCLGFHCGKVFLFVGGSGLSWLRGTAVERRSVTGELSLSYARPAADGRPLMWVNRPL